MPMITHTVNGLHFQDHADSTDNLLEFIDYLVSHGKRITDNVLISKIPIYYDFAADLKGIMENVQLSRLMDCYSDVHFPEEAPELYKKFIDETKILVNKENEEKTVNGTILPLKAYLMVKQVGEGDSFNVYRVSVARLKPSAAIYTAYMWARHSNFCRNI